LVGDFLFGIETAPKAPRGVSREVDLKPRADLWRIAVLGVRLPVSHLLDGHDLVQVGD
jgi:hypothetical protein